MRDGFVSLRLSYAPIPLASLAPVHPLSCVFSSFSSPPLTSTTLPLPLSPSLSLSLSLMRLIDPDPVLFSSLFDSRRVTRTDSPAASRRQGLVGGERNGGSRGSRRDGEDRSDAQVPRYTFSFHLSIRDREREEIERKRKERRALGAEERGRGEGGRKGSGKISAIPPRPPIAAGFSIRFARTNCARIS